jgi:DNA-binding Xre family transcriptional regulator
MAATAQALKTEDPRDRDRAANSVEVWKWLACSLLAILLPLAGYVGRGGITEAKAVEIVSGPSNPYVQDKAALQQRQENTSQQLEEMRGKLDTVQRQLTRICIALGVDPDGNVEVQHKTRRTE